MSAEDLHPERFDESALTVFRSAGVPILDESTDLYGNPTGRVPWWAGIIYLRTVHGQDERALRRMVADEEFRDAALVIAALDDQHVYLREFLDAEL